MIARSRTAEEPHDWQSQLRNAYRDPLRLLDALDIDAADVSMSDAAARLFPFRVPHAYATRMRRGDPHDPLLRQVLPRDDETETNAGFADDPVGETSLIRNSSLIQKYHGRALLMVSGACAINCRYCFRRAFPYGATVGDERLAQAVEKIAQDLSLSEIILSGGDPLVVDDESVAALFTALESCSHIKRIRIHTRLPIVLPARITSALLRTFSASPQQTIIVVHVNHAREIDAATADALGRCRAAGITLLNQSVLLRGVNDDAEVLAELSTTLFAAGVMPYYVNLLDRVTGTAHFEVDDSRALELEQGLRARLPGYLVPRFVREIPGAPAKLPLI